MQIIAKTGKFDCAHRIVNHNGACNNVHGHTYHYDLMFSFDSNTQEDPELGYAIDFSEIKRIAVAWLDANFDHAYVSNPIDTLLVEIFKSQKYKVWVMSLNGKKSCNPSVENMAKEILIAMLFLFKGRGITPHSLKLYETESSYTICDFSSISDMDIAQFSKANLENINKFRLEKGKLSYNKLKQPKPKVQSKPLVKKSTLLTKEEPKKTMVERYADKINTEVEQENVDIQEELLIPIEQPIIDPKSMPWEINLNEVKAVDIKVRDNDPRFNDFLIDIDNFYLAAQSKANPMEIEELFYDTLSKYTVNNENQGILSDFNIMIEENQINIRILFNDVIKVAGEIFIIFDIKK